MLYRCCSSGAHSTSRATPHSPATTGSRQHTWTQAVDSRAHPSPRRAGTINSATHSLRSARIQSTAHTRTHTLSPGFSPTWVATVGQRSACICRQPAVAGGHITLSIAAEPEQARSKHAASTQQAHAQHERAMTKKLLCRAVALHGPHRGYSRVSQDRGSPGASNKGHQDTLFCPGWRIFLLPEAEQMRRLLT